MADSTGTPAGSNSPLGPRRFAFVAEVVDGVDAGRDVCRIHPEAMALLGVRAWEPVELSGDSGGRAAALAGHLDWQAARNTCVIDTLLAENLEVTSGDRVVIAPVRPVPAASVTLRALERVELPATALRAALLGKAVVTGERESLLPQDFTQAFSQNAAEEMRRLRDCIGPAWRSLRVEVRATDPGGVVTIVPSTRLEWTGDVPAAGPATVVEPGELVGLDTQRAELRELMELAFGNSALLDGLGVAPPRGVLLQGPVGCGKASMARSLATELEVTARTLSGLDLGRQDAKAATAAVEDAFATPTRPIVLVLEDVDVVCPADPEEATATSAALLRALDAAGGTGFFVVATTAVPEACDPALFAEGRLERRIDVPLPDRDVRRRILEVHTRALPLAADVDLGAISARTPGFAGADLHRLCRQAGLTAAGRLRSAATAPATAELVAQVTATDFATALDHVRPSTMGGAHVDTGAVTWADVGDAVELKQALTESVMWPVRFPDTFARLGLSPPRGVLLYGPPGCGKTFVVRALAGEAEANLLAVKGAELLSKWVGESEAGVRDVFRRARAAAPAIVFLDEIDALAPVRGASTDSGVTDRVVAALLTEIDGIEPMRGVAVVAATNRPDLVDPALLRPGRLERHVFVELPDAAARTEILVAACRSMPLGDGVDLAGIASRAEGFSAADLAALCREAGYAALHRDPQVARISVEDFELAGSRMRPSVDPGVVARLRDFRSQ